MHHKYTRMETTEGTGVKYFSLLFVVFGIVERLLRRIDGVIILYGRQ
jgi:hypothetical protein